MWRIFLPRWIRFLWSFLVQYLTINVLSLASLAIGYAACILVGLYVLDEFTFDRFIPGADRVYMLSASYGPKGEPLVDSDWAPPGMAPWMRQSLPELDSVTRLNPVDWPVRSAKANIYAQLLWADANVFDVLKLPFIAGDPRTALTQPNSLVLTQRMARRYFGREDVIGQTLVVNENTRVQITAVLRDFPANTTLGREMFLSGGNQDSMLKAFDVHPAFQWPSTYVFLRLKPGASPARAEARLMPILTQHWDSPNNQPERMRLVPLTAVHFQPVADNEMKVRGHRDTVVAMICVAVLILTLAIVNFTGMMIARIDERGYEMAIRKALGARSGDLILQVLSEGAAISVVGFWLGLAVVERLEPLANHTLGLALNLWAHPVAIPGLGTLAALFLGVAGGLYPALVLSAVWPIQGLRSRGQHFEPRSIFGRQGWLVVQFALAITLLVCAHTVYRQWTYVTARALNFNADNVLIVSYVPATGGGETFNTDVRQLKGVTATAFSRWGPIEKDIRPAWAKTHDGTLVSFTRHSVDDHFFQLYGVPLLAGRNFSGVDLTVDYPHEVIINRTAARAMGFATPADAVGHDLNYGADRLQLTSRVIGVVDDMRFSTVRAPMRPMLFDNHTNVATVLSIKLRPEHEAETLAAIDRLWTRDAPRTGPIDRQYFSAYLADQYGDMFQQREIFGFLSLVGVCLSGLCLVGLSIFFARSRKREVAIRRALGADFWTIFRLRLAPFLKPLVISNLVAWPLGAILMLSWLHTFADHVALAPQSFAGATLITALVALLTVGMHAVAVARYRPVQPLRHE